MRPLFFLALFFVPSLSMAITADELVTKANHASYYQGDDGRATVKMTITDSAGRERQREFTIIRRDDDPGDTKDSGQKFYVYLQRPADVYKTVFMVWKHLDKDDDRWLYLPALDLVKRIAASDKRTSFVGSHFYYEDVSGRNPQDDTHEIIEETKNYYILKSVPKDKKSVEFSSYKNWIHKTTFIPVKTEFYDDSGNVYRTYTASKVETVDGFNTVTEAQMEDKNIGGKTVMSYGEVKYNIELPEDIFTERYLRNAPRKYLH